VLDPTSSRSETAPGGGSAVKDRTCPVEGADDVPTCETGILERYSFVFNEIRAMIRGRQRRGGEK